MAGTSTCRCRCPVNGRRHGGDCRPHLAEHSPGVLITPQLPVWGCPALGAARARCRLLFNLPSTQTPGRTTPASPPPVGACKFRCFALEVVETEAQEGEMFWHYLSQGACREARDVSSFSASCRHFPRIHQSEFFFFFFFYGKYSQEQKTMGGGRRMLGCFSSDFSFHSASDSDLFEAHSAA